MSMDRLQTKSNYENQLRSGLFRQLFHFQTELEQFNNEHFEYHRKIQEIIDSTDELMESLLKSN